MRRAYFFYFYFYFVFVYITRQVSLTHFRVDDNSVTAAAAGVVIVVVYDRALLLCNWLKGSVNEGRANQSWWASGDTYPTTTTTTAAAAAIAIAIAALT